jgi:hypothetical protein
MFTLSGFSQVLDLLETRGRFRKFTLRTPEGFTYEASLWKTEGLLEEPLEGMLFSFSGFCPCLGTVTLTGFRPAQGLDPALVPPTVSGITGVIVKVQEEDFALEYSSYDKASKETTQVLHTVVLKGDRWSRRKTVLRTGTQVQVLGTLEGLSTTDCDDFWVFFKKDPEPSPQKKIFSNVFAGRPAQPKPLVILSEDEDHLIELGGPSSPSNLNAFSVSSPSPPSSPTILPIPVDDEVFTVTGKGKAPAKRQRRI